MLLKCCTQYICKFGKLSSGHRPEKGQFSFQSQRRAMPKNLQTTTQLHSFHMLARLCSRSFKLAFSSMWTENFQMYKLGLGKAKEPRSNCQHFLGHRESNGIQENIYLCLIDYTKAFDSVDHNKLWKTLKEMRIPDNPTYLLKNMYVDQDVTVRTGHRMTGWFHIGKRVHQSCICCHPAYFTSMQSTSWEMLDWMKHKLESRLLGEIQ